MGTVVVDAPTYESLLGEMLGKGFTADDLQVRIEYRLVYSRDIPGGYMLDFQNRGISPLVKINTF
jgi:hypothetical protein